MKKILIILVLTCLSCSSDNNENEEQNVVPQEDTLIGAWKLIELNIFVINSDETQWNPIPDSFSHTYMFTTDNIVTRSNYTCDGIFDNNPSDYLVITFDCPENPDAREYYISFDNHNLILTPPGSCDESGACASKYEKIDFN